MKNKNKHRYLSHKKRRKRLKGELRSIFYSTDGMGLWRWVEKCLRRVVPATLYLARGCLLISAALAVGLILLVKSPWLWFVVAGFALMALMIKSMFDMYQDMERERRRLRLKIKKERARVKAKVAEEHAKAIGTIKTLKQELSQMRKICDFLMWQVQYQKTETNVPKNLTLQLVFYNNLNNMNFLGDVNTNGGNIYGDNAIHNETHYHYGSEQETKVTMEGGLSPYVTLLRKMIDPLRESGNWRAVICPYKAAVIEGVLPSWPHKTFCSQAGVQIPASSYSEWMNTDKYTEDELEPYSVEFQRLKASIANSE